MMTPLTANLITWTATKYAQKLRSLLTKLVTHIFLINAFYWSYFSKQLSDQYVKNLLSKLTVN